MLTAPPPAKELPNKTLVTNKDKGMSADKDHWASTLLVESSPVLASHALIEAVKIAVYHLLDQILRNYCDGCKMNLPSPQQHNCLKILDDYFYKTNYFDIRRRLVTERFLPAIKQLLTDLGIEELDAKVGIVADTLLYDLQSERKILDALSDAYRKLVGADVVKHGLLQKVTKVYESSY